MVRKLSPPARPRFGRTSACLASALIALLMLAPEAQAAAGLPAAANIQLRAGSGVVMPVAVFGADDRVPVPAQYSALQEGIGLLINNRARTVCTAFCVAGDIIATAAHCLFKTKGEIAPRLVDFVF